jgi:hypothetical protein
VPAEIVVIVEDEDARILAARAAVEPRGGEPADPAADHDEIVLFLRRQALDRKRRAVAGEGVRRLERSGVLAAQPVQQRRIARRLCGNLRGRREPGGDVQRHAVDEIAPGDGSHAICPPGLRQRGRRPTLITLRS